MNSHETIIRGRRIGMNLTLIVFGLLFCFALLSASDNPDQASVVDTLDKSDDCLQRVSWLEGHWRGEGFGGMCEEIWGPVFGDSRMGMFRLVQDDKVVFYEFIFIGMVDGTLTKRLRHFNADMSGWEEKDEWVEFPFVGCTENTMAFEGLTYYRMDDDTVRLVVSLKGDDGQPTEVELIYHRVSKS